MGSVNKLLKGTGLLIGLYLVVAYASGSGRVLSTAFKGGSDFARTLQGRG